MFSTLRNFLNRHKRKFFVAGIVVGGSAIAFSYIQRKIREWQERETRNFLDMTRKKQHFESTERTCNQTVLSLAPAVCESVMDSLDTQKILATLRGNPENKVHLWEELKVLTFARVSSMVYSFTILVVTLRIQLNIIGGYLYKDSMNIDCPPQINSDLQQKYLSLCHYFVSEGIEKLSNQIEGKVRGVIQPISLKQKLSLKDTEQLFWSIQTSLCLDNSDPLKQIISYLISDTNTSDDAIFKALLNETMDMLESEEVASLSTSCVSRAFALLVDQIAEFFTPISNGKVSANQLDHHEQGTSNGFTSKSQLNSFVNVNKIELPLAKLIPIVNGLISQPLGRGLSGVSNSIMQQLVLNDKLKVLGANVYEVFST